MVIDAPENPETAARAIPCLCCHEDGVAFYSGVWVCLTCTFAYCASCKRCLACCEHNRESITVRFPVT